MSANIIKLSSPKDKLIVSREFTEQFNAALAKCEEVGAEFKHELEYVKGLVVDEDSIQAIKKSRSGHNAVFKEYDDQRKCIKGAISAPYDAFNKKFKECITDIHGEIDNEYKHKIAEYEEKLIADKTADVKVYYNEYLAASGIVEEHGEFFSFDNIGLNINLSVSAKKLKEKVKDFVDRVGDDLALIKTQSYADEIYYEYKHNADSFLNVSRAIQTVAKKKAAIEAEKARKAEHVANATPTDPPKEPAAPEALDAPVPEEKPIKVKFWAEATPTQIRALMDYMKNGGIRFGNAK